MTATVTIRARKRRADEHHRTIDKSLLLARLLATARFRCGDTCLCSTVLVRIQKFTALLHYQLSVTVQVCKVCWYDAMMGSESGDDSSNNTSTGFE